MSKAENILTIRNLTKRFYGSLALDHVDFSLEKGEIHALIGENGAGKSTFIKILAGVYACDGGEITLDGQVVDPRTDSLSIAFVHQDPAFAEELSVGENIAFGMGYPRRRGLIDWSAVKAQAVKIYEAMEIAPLDPDRLVSTLTAPEKAILAIVRTLALAPKVLVLDEPTAALPEADSVQLFKAMRRLRSLGTSMIYVSHRLNELFGLADRVTVFRNGRHIVTEPMAGATGDGLIEHMLGRPPVKLSGADPRAETRGSAVLEVRDLTIGGRGPVSFEAQAGEILGLVGLRGGGQEAIGRAIFGALPITSGVIILNGKPLPQKRSIGDSIEFGIRLLAGDRSAESAFAGMNLVENIFVNPRIRGGSMWRWTSPAREREEARQIIDRFDVRPRREASLIDWLSGGNQQKTCLARWLNDQGDLVILEEPTSGVDIGAKLAIHKILRGYAAGGRTMLVISTDLEEVAALCDRAIIVSRGRQISELAGPELTLDQLVSHSSQGGRHAVSI
ncbi:sugar ABC transporter ATP-binding protein [Acidisoma cellulosilytica]|uniref:Sugar ABC transporter ATP-binding protein n=1 Tax=Acidisoma cellulosilyticum TaxID=2802395 RepID=A0A963Z3Q8_9PROT|nr:sugar ABC transporter ATP-binding protein [Acidisoma cellulosilyticum]MCB8882259.1 sugar ABC transporter ATP-binding protein [Acidisoma cellulosilyticum]